MRISRLLGAVIALSMLTAMAPARADLSGGDLMVTDLFRWQGQDGAPTWREILANFDGSEELTFYLWNVPSPPPQFVVPAPGIHPVLAPYLDPFDPIGTTGGASSVFISAGDGVTTGVAPVGGFSEAVPETSTWAMMLMGFAGLGYAGYRQAKRLSRTPGNRASAA